MDKMQMQLREWHTRFGVLVNDKPTLPDVDTKILRKRLIVEEMAELIQALDADDMVEIADGIADSLYVIIGTAVSYGIEVEPVFDEVHRSNMSKVWADGSVRRDKYGKVLKPPTYSPAQIRNILGRQS